MAYLLDVAHCYMAFTQACGKIHGQVAVETTNLNFVFLPPNLFNATLEQFFNFQEFIFH